MRKSRKTTQKNASKTSPMVAATMLVDPNTAPEKQECFGEFVALSNAAWSDGGLASFCQFSVDHGLAGKPELCDMWAKALANAPAFTGSRDPSNVSRYAKTLRQPLAFLALREAWPNVKNENGVKRDNAIKSAYTSVLKNNEKDAEGNPRIVQIDQESAKAALQDYVTAQGNKAKKAAPKPNSQAALKQAIAAAWLARRSLRKLDAANMTLEALAVHFGIVEMED